MIKIQFCYWSNVSQVLAVKVKDIIIINVAGFVVPVTNAVKKLKRRSRNLDTTENRFLAQYHNAGFFPRLAVRMLLVAAQLRMAIRR